MCIYIYTHLKLDLMTFSHPHTQFWWHQVFIPAPIATKTPRNCRFQVMSATQMGAPTPPTLYVSFWLCWFWPLWFLRLLQKDTQRSNAPLIGHVAFKWTEHNICFICLPSLIPWNWLKHTRVFALPTLFFGLIITWAGTWDLKIVAVRQHPQKSDKKSAVLRGNFGFLAAVKQPDRLFCRSRPVFHQESSGIWPISIHEFHVLRKHHTHMTHIYSCLYEIDWYENGAPLTSSCCWNHF